MRIEEKLRAELQEIVAQLDKELAEVRQMKNEEEAEVIEKMLRNVRPYGDPCDELIAIKKIRVYIKNLRYKNEN